MFSCAGTCSFINSLIGSFSNDLWLKKSLFKQRKEKKNNIRRSLLRKGNSCLVYSVLKLLDYLKTVITIVCQIPEWSGWFDCIVTSTMAPKKIRGQVLKVWPLDNTQYWVHWRTRYNSSHNGLLYKQQTRVNMVETFEPTSFQQFFSCLLQTSSSNWR